jgi:hypothetical protein
VNRGLVDAFEVEELGMRPEGEVPGLTHKGRLHVRALQAGDDDAEVTPVRG